MILDNKVTPLGAIVKLIVIPRELQREREYLAESISILLTNVIITFQGAPATSFVLEQNSAGTFF